MIATILNYLVFKNKKINTILRTNKNRLFSYKIKKKLSQIKNLIIMIYRVT
jgi:hypothetical protein